MAVTIEVHVNGRARELPEGTTLGDLLAELGLDHDGVAVAVDREVVPRSQRDTRTLAAGARVEVIRAVGGG
jgi:sulfur carrier protein